MFAVFMAGTAQHARAQAAGGQAAAPAAGGQAAAQTAQPQKKVKDQGEYDIYNNVLKDAGGQAWAKSAPPRLSGRCCKCRTRPDP